MTAGHLRLVSRRGDRRAVASVAGGVIVHAVGDCEDVPRLAGVAWALDSIGGFEQLTVDASADSGAARALADLDVPAAVRRLDVAGASAAQRLGALEEAMFGAVATTAVTAVMVYADDDAALAAALAAARQTLPMVYVAGSARRRGRRARLIAHLADLVLVAEEDDVTELVRRGVDAERLRAVGDPLADAVRRAAARRAWLRPGMERRRYVFAAIDRSDRPELAAELALLAARWRSVVALSPAVEAAWRGSPPFAALKASPARLLAWRGCVDRVALAGAAGTVVTDCDRLREAAALVGIPVHDPADVLSVRPLPRRDVVPMRAGRAGRRVAEAMVTNFARLRLDG